MKPPDPRALREKVEERRAHLSIVVTGVLLKVHREVYVRSKGRVGAKTLGVPCLLLTVRGRSTSRPQCVALVYATDGSDLVVVASKGGSAANPDWFENLRVRPDVDVQIAQRRLSATSEIVDQNDRRYPRLWRLVNENNSGRYYHYQHATKRPIPIVLLHPEEVA
jgi:deazaflavin-dependent oxidoreductase (nitroreductase family)